MLQIAHRGLYPAPCHCDVKANNADTFRIPHLDFHAFGYKLIKGVTGVFRQPVVAVPLSVTGLGCPAIR